MSTKIGVVVSLWLITSYGQSYKRQQPYDQTEWNKLNEPERAWVLGYRSTGKEPTLSHGVAVGEVGMFQKHVIIRVVQVLDKSSFLGELHSDLYCGKSDYCLDAAAAIFTAYDTSKMVDGSTVPANGIHYVATTTTYETVLGAKRTVFLIGKLTLDTAKLKQVIPPREELAKATKKKP